MQILPDSSTATVGDALSSALAASHTPGSPSGRDEFGFAKVFAAVYESTPAEVTPALEDPHPFDNSDPQQTDSSFLTTDEPYSATDSVPPSTLDTAASVPTAEIRLNDAELNKVAENLRKDGVDEATIQRVKDLAGKPGGVSVADVVKAVANEEPAKLTEGDLHRIKALADKLDNSGALSESVLNDLRDGKVSQAWASLMQALNTAEPNATMDIERDDVLSLGKAMRLDAGTLDKLSKSFGRQDTLQLTPDGFKALMVPAQQALLKTETARHKLALSLETAFKPVIKDARERLESEALAGGRTSRRVQQSETLIQDTVTRNSFVRAGDAETSASAKKDPEAEKTTTRTTTGTSGATGTNGTNGTNGATEANGTTSVSGAKGTNGTNGATGTSGTNGTSGATEVQGKTNVAQSAAGPVVAAQTAGQTSQPGQTIPVGQANQTGVVAGQVAGQHEQSHGQEAAQDNGQGKNSFMGSDGSARNVNGLISAKTAETPANPWEALLQRLDVAPATVVMNGVTPSKLAQTQAPSPLSGRVLSQVEQGMLTAMRDGTKRLELQLNPLDLGSVNVLLTSRNGEVSALLRPERPETASLLMQQMDQLRINLEEQGVKVDKVDVQTQLKDDSGMSWQGMSQHNSAQEQQSRGLELERLRRLGRVHASGIESRISPELAGMARTSSRAESLHIVA